MRRSYLFLLIALVVFSASIIIPLRSAQAGEITHSGFQCWMDDDYVDLDGILPEDPFFTTNSYQRESASGNRMMVCRYEGVIEDLAQAYTRMRFMCGVWLDAEMTTFAVSNKSKLVLTPNGDMMYFCKLNHKDVPPPTVSATVGTASDTGDSSTFLPGVGATDGAASGDGGQSPAGGSPPPADDAPTGSPPPTDDTPPANDTPPPTDGSGSGGNESSGGNCGNDKNVGNGANNGCGNGKKP